MLLISIIVAAICFVVILTASKLISSHSKESPSENIQKEEKFSTESEDDVEKLSAEADGSENDRTDDEQVTGGSQLAFGPYIAIALIAYAALFDYIYYLVGLYLNLF